MKDSNIGQSGQKSIRIDGMKIDNLPLGQGNEAKAGLADFLKTDKETKENNVVARYPKHKRPFLESQIRECKRNIQKIKNFKAELKEKISEYRQLIKDCEYRDKEMEKHDPDKPEDQKAIKELRLKYPPYNIEAMQQQIIQFEEGIERCDETIEQDYNSVSKISGILALVEQKERELKNID